MKKMKLLMSLSMLCLSIAMLCFGVFAASSVTYTISGTISYTVNDVFCKITCNLYSVKTVTASSNLSSTATSLATSGVSDTTTYTAVGSASAYEVGASATTGTNSTGDLAIQFGSVSSVERYTYYIVLTIENLADRNFKANLSTVAAKKSETAISTVVVAQSVNLTSVVKGTAQRIVIGCSITDKTTSISDGKLSGTLTLSYS